MLCRRQKKRNKAPRLKSSLKMGLLTCSIGKQSARLASRVSGVGYHNVISENTNATNGNSSQLLEFGNLREIFCRTLYLQIFYSYK